MEVKKYYLLIKVEWKNKLKFIYFPWGKAFKKQRKTIEKHGKQVDKYNGVIFKNDYDTENNSLEILR